VTQRLEQALTVDMALSERQVARQYGLSLEACRKAGFEIQTVNVAPTARMKVTRAVKFITLEPLELPAFEFRHLAGIAEMRYQLGARLEDWRLVHHSDHTSPDAIWQRGLETWAVEFDAGSYSQKTILEKVRSFRAGFDGQHWAVASDARARFLAGVLLEKPIVVRGF
jgi:Replication-relaxation